MDYPLALEAYSLIKRKTDSEARVQSELFNKLPSRKEYPDYYEEIAKPISLRQIKEKLDFKHYQNLSEFQDDVVLCFENAKQYNVEGSEIFDDAEELQRLFIKFMNKRTGTEVALTQTISKPLNDRKMVEELVVESKKYKVGDYVYFVETEGDKKKQKKKNILQIHQLWHDCCDEIEGKTVGSSPSCLRDFGVLGCHYLFPEQTFHVPTRKFFENEVFKTTATNIEVFGSSLRGHCLVLSCRDFCRGRPVGWNDSSLQRDVYVCESRYLDSGKKMEVVKNWKATQPHGISPPELETFFDEPVRMSKTVVSSFLEAYENERAAERAASEKASAEKAAVEQASASASSSSCSTTTLTFTFTPPPLPSSLSSSSSSTTPPPPPPSPSSSSSSSSSHPRYTGNITGGKWTIRQTISLLEMINKYGVGEWEAMIRDPLSEQLFGLKNNVRALRERHRMLSKKELGPPSIPELLMAERECKHTDYLNYIDFKRSGGGTGLLPHSLSPFPSSSPSLSPSPSLVVMPNAPGLILSDGRVQQIFCDFDSCPERIFQNKDDLLEHWKWHQEGKEAMLVHHPLPTTTTNTTASSIATKTSSELSPSFSGKTTGLRRSTKRNSFMSFQDGVELPPGFVEAYQHSEKNEMIWFDRPPHLPTTSNILEKEKIEEQEEEQEEKQEEKVENKRREREEEVREIERRKKKQRFSHSKIRERDTIVGLEDVSRDLLASVRCPTNMVFKEEEGWEEEEEKQEEEEEEREEEREEGTKSIRVSDINGEWNELLTYMVLHHREFLSEIE
eukprot:Lithocolla_globosa_v1_NODE_1416_length_2594_cov_2.861417.p1 type:complete len:788 gc:universal NODE_1416_length_2594_cov_2.861417:2424-61(-)